MGLPQFKSCFCGCTLRAGTLILLWLHTIVCAMILLYFLAVPFIIPIYSGSSLSFSNYGVYILIVGIITAVGIAGIHGVNKDRHSYLVPCLIWIGSLTVLLPIALIVFAVGIQFVAKEEKISHALAASAGLVIGAFISFALNCYFWLVVYSYYRILKQRSSSRDME